MSFEANQGQADEQVKFLARGTGYALYLTATEAVLQLRNKNPQSAIRNPQSTTLRMKVVGAAAQPRAAGLDKLPGKSNYLIGNDPKKWQTGVPTYAKVKYTGVYPGIDMVYYGNNQRQLEYDFIVAPGADPKQIALDFAGADKLQVDAQGDLLLHLADGQVRLQAPVIYQEKDGVKHAVAGGYRQAGAHQVGFEIAAYDAARPLVIDPVLAYSTYLGGSGLDFGRGIAVNKHGDAFVTGATLSLDFPTKPLGAKIGPGGGWDAFVAKLGANGSLLYSTYLGGSDDENFHGNVSFGGIGVDAGGHAYVTGITKSADFPFTAGAFRTNLNGYADAFVVKLNPAGSAPVYATFVGGSGFDGGQSIAVDPSGNAYITGQDESGDLPVVNGFQPTHAVGCLGPEGSGYKDGFVAKLNAAGSAMLYSTYFGGNACNLGWGIAVDAAQNVYVMGETLSTNFPTTPGAFDTSCGTDGACNPPAPGKFGLADIFVTKLDTKLAGPASLLYSTYLGGSGEERVPHHGIAVDLNSNVYVTGLTTSTNFPTTPNTPKPTLPPLDPYDAFVTKFNPQLSGLVYSTYLGGGGGDAGSGIAVDLNGNAYVAGSSGGTFPTNQGFTTCTDPGAFVVKVNPAGSTLVYSACLSGAGQDTALDIAVDPAGCAYVTGFSESVYFPTVNALQPNFAGGQADAFITKICSGLDHFKCYDVRAQEPFQPFNARLIDQFETQVVTVLRPIMLCNPTVKCVNGDCTQVVNPDDHLVCYETKDAGGATAFEPREVIVSNQFGQQQRLTVWRRKNMLCVPSLKAHVDNAR